ncbi:sensor domain-containing protein, partial [Actinomadura adrarensis]
MGELSGTATTVAGTRAIIDGSWHPLAMVRSSLTWRAAVYLCASLFIGLAWFISLTVGLALSIGLTIIWVGIPMLALMMVYWRFAAVLERTMTLAAFGVRIPSPYRPLPEGLNPFTKLKAMAVDRATWKDLAFLYLHFPISIAEFALVATVWMTAGTFLALPLIAMADGGVEINLFVVSFWAENALGALPGTLVGVLLAVLAMYVTRLAAIGHVIVAR